MKLSRLELFREWNAHASHYLETLRHSTERLITEICTIWELWPLFYDIQNNFGYNRLLYCPSILLTTSPSQRPKP